MNLKPNNGSSLSPIRGGIHKTFDNTGINSRFNQGNMT